MKWFYCLLFFFLGALTFTVNAQVSSDCGNAVPICNNTPANGGTNGYGTDDFNSDSKSGCLEKTQSGFIESNSAWYRFKTGEAGQLGFNISFDKEEDWDFALYRASDCNDLGEPVRCNFYDNQDNLAFTGVGEDPTGAFNIQYEDWLNVTAGEEYYLLINNFSNNNSGFSIQFSGQIFVDFPNTALDCSIINNLLGPPIAACENDTITLNATTTDASGYNWYMDDGNGFVILSGENSETLNVTTTAVYRVEVFTTTGNTIISDVQVGFSTTPMTNTVVDVSVCEENLPFDFSVKDGEALGSQSPNEFRVSYHSSQMDALEGINALPKLYDAQVGTITIYMRTTSYANPMCFDTSEQFQLVVTETPVTMAETQVYLCEGESSVTIGELLPEPDYTYHWTSGETASSLDVSTAGSYELTISYVDINKPCKRIVTIDVVIGASPRITDVIVDDLQANNMVTILTDVQGNFEYRLDDSDFQEESTFNNVSAGAHTVTILDKNGCGSVTENIVVVGFANYFTPNGDGTNDTWSIEGMTSLDSPVLSIYDRYGKLIKQLQGNQNWDGTYRGTLLPESDYWFKLSYKDAKGDWVVAKYINNHFSLKR